MSESSEPTPIVGESKGWHNYAPVIHTAPINDLLEHDLGDHKGGCVCGPRVEVNEDGVHLIHNALDGRELTEEDFEGLIEHEDEEAS